MATSRPAFEMRGDGGGALVIGLLRRLALGAHGHVDGEFDHVIGQEGLGDVARRAFGCRWR